MDDLHFEGDPATDSTRRRLERVLKEESRPRWHWMAALAAGGVLFWQVRKRRRNGNGRDTDQGQGRRRPPA